jgi:hypothetical protein
VSKASPVTPRPLPLRQLRRIVGSWKAPLERLDRILTMKRPRAGSRPWQCMRLSPLLLGERRPPGHDREPSRRHFSTVPRPRSAIGSPMALGNGAGLPVTTMQSVNPYGMFGSSRGHDGGAGTGSPVNLFRWSIVGPRLTCKRKDGRGHPSESGQVRDRELRLLDPTVDHLNNPSVHLTDRNCCAESVHA